MGISRVDQALVLDVETTGLKPNKDRIVSIALIKASFDGLALDGSGRGNIRTVSNDYLFDPGITIPKAASRVHGFTNEMLKGKPRFSDKASEIRDFVGDLPIIAHNVDFDGAFLDAEFARAGIAPLTRNKRYCTMKEAHRRACLIHGEDVKWPKLVEAGPYAGVKLSQEKVHDAMEDARNALMLVAGFRNTTVRNGELINTFSAASGGGQNDASKRTDKGGMSLITKVLVSVALLAVVLILLLSA